MIQSCGWLIDKSALARLTLTRESDLWQDRITRGMVHISPLTLLEVGFSARSETDWVSLQHEPPITDMPVEAVVPRAEARALEVQRLLARRGTHRGPGPADLLIAAAAEETGLTVLHVDKDFELIAEVTGQPMERLAGDF
ncbi:PIN domain nuclease [uncultured Agrococcus sp.]|uniref:PIN domain nuclease n=1 Tax=uncultured Agrococcus sp. TaxID=382258 RepID=UPI0025FC3DC0|nr:PIN domain nuclease [uncultured Agrococcus sp.]